ncbi:ABC transporter permease [Rhodopseudomonas sp.]|uniref:ABC transporter permease n=1 Tax=Rhodopseudomonas sp. TaxID=1078 RepID=UPI0039E41492
MTAPGFIADRAFAALRFLWGAWAGLAAVALLAALWQAGHEAYGDFILPAPLATLSAAGGIIADPHNWSIALETVRRALQGFVAAACAGSVVGLIAGYSPATMRLARPLLTVILGVPPIAWIVLAMIWFGSTDGTVLVTIVIAATPLMFVGAAEGVASRDRGLDDMARAFGATAWQRVATVGMRHVAAHVFPALTISLGTAFKVAVMAELLANTGGIGGALARARSNLDVANALAWVMISVGALIIIEYGVVHPIRSTFERWREAARPWGIKR